MVASVRSRTCFRNTAEVLEEIWASDSDLSDLDQGNDEESSSEDNYASPSDMGERDGDNSGSDKETRPRPSRFAQPES